MILIILGAPGSGKGTQSKFISKKFSIPQLSTGDILRFAIKNNTDIGFQAKQFIDAGKLVPDDVMIKIIQDRIAEFDCLNGFILDGFPRTLAQSSALDLMLEAKSLSIDKVLSFQLDSKILIERITGRLINPKTGKEYHEKFNPPKNLGFCDITGDALIKRSDDTEEKARKRILIFEKEILSLIHYYSKMNIFCEINAHQSIEGIKNEIFNILSKK